MKLKYRIKINVSSSLLNGLYFLIILPLFLYLLKQQIPLIGWQSLIFFLLSIGYLIQVFHTSLLSWGYAIAYISSAIVFMRVTAGNTIPTWMVLSIIGIVGWFSHEILSDNQMKSIEMNRQFVLSGAVLSFFLWYTFLFGAIFVTTLPPMILFITCLVYTAVMSFVLLQLYAIPHALLYSGLIAWGISILYHVFRLIPYTHTTQAGILTLITFYSIFIFREIYYIKGNLLKPLLIRLIFIIILIVSLLGTAGQTVI